VHQPAQWIGRAIKMSTLCCQLEVLWHQYGGSRRIALPLVVLDGVQSATQLRVQVLAKVVIVVVVVNLAVV
jgi:hypothetical protein